MTAAEILPWAAQADRTNIASAPENAMPLSLEICNLIKLGVNKPISLMSNQLSRISQALLTDGGFGNSPGRTMTEKSTLASRSPPWATPMNSRTIRIYSAHG